MAPLVRDRGDRLVVVVVVHQHVRVHVVGIAIHVGAGQLVRARVRIHPAVIESVGHGVDIVLAERRYRFQHELAADVVGQLDVAVHERRIDVVVMQLRHAQQLRPQAEVAIERRQVRFGLRDQHVEDGHRDIVGIERARNRIGIPAHFRVHRILLELRIQIHADGAFIGLERGEEGVHHLLAVLAVRSFAVLRVGRCVERDLFAGGQLDFRPRYVGIGEDPVGRSAGVVHEAEFGEQRFAFVVQRVRRHPRDPGEREPVDRKRRLLLQELRNPVLADAQNLGIDERGGLGDPGADQVGLLVELLIGRVPGVLGSLLARIDGEAVVALGDVGLQVEALLQSRRAVCPGGPCTRRGS